MFALYSDSLIKFDFLAFSVLVRHAWSSVRSLSRSPFFINEIKGGRVGSVSPEFDRGGFSQLAANASSSEIAR
jgi:hypothetical protein